MDTGRPCFSCDNYDPHFEGDDCWFDDEYYEDYDGFREDQQEYDWRDDPFTEK